jgi:hypothetical protein
MNDHHESRANENQSTNDNLELFKQALNEVSFEVDESIQYTPSRRHKIRMNRMFRERVGGTFLPFREADTPFERVRSKIVVMFKINDILDKKNEKSNKKQRKTKV